METKKLGWFTRNVRLTFLGVTAPTPNLEADALQVASVAVRKGESAQFMTDTGISVEPDSKTGRTRMLTISIKADLWHGEKLNPAVIAALKDYVIGLESGRFGNDDSEDFQSERCRVLTIAS